MPNVVLLAKNAFVWLDQLSKKYHREIRTLDQVPDEELDQICKWNFKGLWLIGIWERSPASKRIKHIMGNIDAVASAYSLYDYRIAHDLGGEKAYENLNKRAKARGIRLASDMVPNHTGLVSDWIKNHPEYFIQSDFPPFPNYTFNGPDLSDDPEYQIRIEDGYYERRDAAVVFQRRSNKTGEVKYIYHGNDGTSMPWNDTAQLNLMKPEVREAIIQKIFDVARKFSIIRFDAAMTLTKKHYQRLWFPQPGTGGDIPSRADYAMTRGEFDDQFPQEFWREVVDRFNKELPETLLLAEAFWLMEGYFVRSLGMHRVYNSAFMHMMMKEENEKYRDLISNTLEFEPEILKRYVNFMSNPDEETSIKQFGTDDKYFGVLTLMVTLPGLPMFAHGQIEGFTEKYGMEYKRAYYNESPNEWLVERHQREIFSLMKKRYVFSEVNNFWLFDVHKDYGEGINENVYAYTNSAFGEKSLVLVNNKFEEAYGNLYESAPKLVNRNGGKYAETRRIHEALEIRPEENYYYIYKDHNEKMEYIIPGQDIVFNGWRVELGAFKYKVYLDFREVYDSTGEYARLKERLGSSGTPNVKRKLEEIRLEPLHNAIKGIFLKEPVQEFIKNYILFNLEENNEKLVPKAFGRAMDVAAGLFKLEDEKKSICKKFNETIEHIEELSRKLINEPSSKKSSGYSNFAHTYMFSLQSNYNETVQIYLLYLVIESLKELFPKEGEINQCNYKEKLMIDIPVRDVLTHLGRGELLIFIGLTLLNIFFERKVNLFNVKYREEEFEMSLENVEVKDYVKTYKAQEFSSLMEDELVRTFLGVNNHDGIWYYSKERFEDLINWFATLQLIECSAEGLELPEIEVQVRNIFHLANYFKEASLQSGYKLEVLEEMITAGEKKDQEETSEKSA